MTLELKSFEFNINPKQLEEWHPFFAFPVYDQSFTETFFMSVINTVSAFKDIGLTFSISTMGDSLISRSRNQLVAKFLSNPQATHLIFIDADIGFRFEDVLKMLWHDKKVITAAYPIKQILWDQVVENVKKDIHPEKLLENSVRFVVNAASNENEQIKIENGLMRIYDAGTGFMIIKREVFLELIEQYPELKYEDDTGALSQEERKWAYAFFNSYIDEDTGRFLSEDYGFCRYYQYIGGEIWVDPAIELSHVGRMTYSGKMVDFLSKVLKTNDENPLEKQIKRKSNKPKKMQTFTVKE